MADELNISFSILKVLVFHSEIRYYENLLCWPQLR